MTEETPARTARTLIRASDRGALGTLLPDGAPYVSLVLTACAHDASPLVLISALAEHTKNLLRDPRGSLLLDATAGLPNPLTGARVSIVGRFAPDDDPALRARYVARHPQAAAYVDFHDFRLWRMTVERAHLVAGFGKIHWVESDALLSAPAPALVAAEPDILRHMNQDHAEAIALYAHELLGLHGDGWLMTGIDAEGIDLRRDGDTARLAFGTPIDGPEQARGVLATLAKQARRHAD
jgi:putative heme iron utilization protein